MKLMIKRLIILFVIMVLVAVTMASDIKPMTSESQKLRNARLRNYISKRRHRRSGTGYAMKCIPGNAKVCRIFKNGSIIKELCLRRRVQKCTSLDRR